MNLIFVGSVYPNNLLEYLLQTGISVSFAANNYQKALLEGFSDYFEKVKIVSYPTITKPEYCDDVFLKEQILSKEEAGFSEFHYVGRKKIKFCSKLLELIRVRKNVKKLLSPNTEDNVVCCYSLHSPFLLALVTLKRKLRKVCVVVPDLPEYMSSKSGLIHKTAKRIDRYLINYCIRRLDCYALLSNAMKDKLPLKDKECALVEGIYCPVSLPEVEKTDKTTILYTGQLQKRYGLFDLVDAFMLIPNKDYELWLCGGGSIDEWKWFESMSKEDHRVKLIGRVSPEDALVLQKKATLLVNPRHSNEEFTKYSFPSKTMEYLASGTPTLMCKLPSIPDEYHKHLFFFEDESIIGMKNKMMEVCKMDNEYLQKKGKEASDFIRSTKNPHYQVSKIVKMLQ